MDKDFVQNYFEKYAAEWMHSGYGDNPYDYPTALNRTRVAMQILNEEFGRPLRIADLGCGGGALAVTLARVGHTVVGVDNTSSMISIADKSRDGEPSDIRERLTFVIGDVEADVLEKDAFDAAISVGVVGYLDTDDLLFAQARRILKPGGLFIISTRNRLFNMYSLTKRTVIDIESGEALRSLEEIRKQYDCIPQKVVRDFIVNLKEISSQALEMMDNNKLKGSEQPQKKTVMFGTNMEPRQHSPLQLKEAGTKCGFDHVLNVGVHPHLLDPNLCRLLPPYLYNMLSDSLTSLEKLPEALLWSSIVVSAFRKP